MFNHERRLEKHLVSMPQNIKASWYDIECSTTNAAWKNIWSQCLRQYFSNIALPEVNTSQLINTGRQIGGEGFEDLDASDILETAAESGKFIEFGEGNTEESSSANIVRWLNTNASSCLSSPSINTENIV
ncbi:hypothetical protein QE152_g4277 [Popillia japonica]|uniref:Uncharacterized protein n=1 Tax=Popillia japonica TaxID=7064 RepID=A0AAW1N1F8_POPJA